MYCKNCGSEIKEGTQFCSNCGTPITVEENNSTEIIEQEIVQPIEQVEENQPVFEEQPKEVFEEQPKIEEITKPKKKINLLPFIIIGILVVLAVAAFLIFFVFGQSTKSIFIKGINDSYSNLSTKIDTLFDSTKIESKKVVSLKSDVDFDININSNLDSSTESILKLINDNNFQINGAFDPNTSNLDLSLLMSNTLGNLQLDAYKRDNLVYIKLKDIYSKLISTPIEMNTTITTSEVNKEDIKYVADTLKKYFVESLNASEDSNFTSEKDEIKYNKETIQTTKITYSIDTKEAQRLKKAIIEKIKADDKLLTILATYSSTSKEELITSLNESSNNEVDTDSQDKILFSIYNESGKTIAYEITPVIDGKETPLYVYDKDNNVQIKLMSDDSPIVLTLDYNKISDTESKITLSASTIKIEATIKKETKKTTLEIKGTEATSGLALDATIVNTDNSSTDNLNVELNLSMNYEEVLSAKINADYEISELDTFPTLDTTNVISSDNLTETDIQEIMTNLQSNEFAMSLISLFLSANQMNY